MTRASPQRRLIEAGGKTTRRHGSERSDEAGPCHVEELAGRPGHARHLRMPTKAGKRPIERAGEPWYVGVFARQRRAAPLVGTIEQPYARHLQLRRDSG